MTVYCATCRITGKKYIGITSQTLKRRIEAHNSSAIRVQHKNIIFHKAIRKYGKDAFEWEVLETCKTTEELRAREVALISEMKTMSPNGYNMTIGGEISDVSDDLRKRYSILSTGRKHTDETKRKCSVSKMGVKNPMSKRVICVETGQVFTSQSEAARFSGVAQALIWMVINKKRGYHTAGGYHWEKSE